jgi:hypothetical protein
VTGASDDNDLSGSAGAAIAVRATSEAMLDAPATVHEVTAYTFTGRVHPERAPLDLVLGPLPLADGGSLRLSIYASQVAVIVETGPETPDIYTLRNDVRDLTASLIDALGYTTGRAYDIELTAVTTDGGAHEVFGIEVPALAASVSERPVEVEHVLLLALSSPWLRRALGELRRAIQAPSDTGFHCFRAVEAVRQHFRAADDSNADLSWQRMRAALNLSRDWLRPLEAYAVPQRHGEVVGMSDAERGDAMTRAWNTVDRFVVLLSENLTALPPERFPKLT